MGKVLRVDLTAKTLKEESIPESVARKYLGGKGYAVYMLYHTLRNTRQKEFRQPTSIP